MRIEAGILQPSNSGTVSIMLQSDSLHSRASGDVSRSVEGVLDLRHLGILRICNVALVHSLFRAEKMVFHSVSFSFFFLCLLFPFLSFSFYIQFLC